MTTGSPQMSAASLRTQEWCTHGVIATALVATPFGLDHFLLPKLTVLTVLVVVGLGAAVLNGAVGWGRGLTALTALLAALTLSSVLSIDPTTALLGSANSRMGVVAWVLLGGVALLGAAHRDVVDIERVFRTLTVVGSVVAVVVIGQSIANGVGSGATTTVGNAGATGTLLAVALVVAVAAVLEGRVWQRSVTGAAAAVQSVALLLAGPRAAVAAAVLGVCVVAAPAWRRLEARARTGSLVGAVAVAAVALFAVPALWSHGDSAVQSAEATASGRADLARMGMEAIAERPVLGWGADLSRPALHPHIPQGFETRHGDSHVQDRVHNVVLDTAVWGGAVAVAALLWFGVSVAIGLRRQRQQWWARIVAAALIAYAVHLLFRSPGAHTDATMWLLIGFAIPLGARRLRPPTWATAVAAVVLLGLTVPSLAQGLVAEFWMGRAVEEEAGLDTAGAGDLFERATEAHATARSLEVRARYELRAGYADRAPEFAIEAEATEPSDPYLTELRVATEAEVALLNRDIEMGKAAVTEARPLVDDSPWDGSLHLVLSTACLAAGDLECALAESLATKQILPLRVEGWRNLGLTHVQLGDAEAARSALTRALELNPEDAASVQALSELGG